jgi:hypothetical protein
VEVRAGVQLRGHALAEARAEQLGRRLLELPDGVDAERRQALRRLGADPVEDAHRVDGEVRDRLLAAHRHERGGLEGRARRLCDQPRGPDADRQRHAGALGDDRHDLAQHRDRQRLLGEVEVALVDARELDHGDPLAHERPDLAARAPVGLEVGRDHDRIGAERARPRGRHRRVHAEAPRLVAGRRHDRARARAGDDHRQAAQLGAATQLDRGVEGVDVEVGDDAARLGHRPDCRTPPRRTAAP